jgi:hypothetical protein
MMVIIHPGIYQGSKSPTNEERIKNALMISGTYQILCGPFLMIK